jgi:hypothetical protein
MDTSLVTDTFTGGPTTDATNSESGSSSGGETSSTGGVTTDETVTLTTSVSADSSSGDTTTAADSSTTMEQPAVCGDGMVSGDETCDGEDFGDNSCASLGFMDGTLVCSADCQGFSTEGCYVCGDGMIAGTEECDGPLDNSIDCASLGFTEGTVSCDMASCTIDTSACTTCGDGVQAGNESCDGGDLAGTDCDTLGFTGGPLTCTASCTFDILSCDVPGDPFGTDVGYNGFSLMPGMTTCDDILGSGTSTGLTDDSNLQVPIGFSFPFYGTDYDNVTIESNGVLHFGVDTYLSYTNDCIPSATMPSDNNLYAFWDDMNPGAGGGVYYETLGAVGDQRFVVQWHTAHFGGDTMDLIDYRVVLYEATGQISVCYVDTLSASNPGDNGAEATSGIQTDSGNGIGFSCNTADLVNGLELLYLPI